jgi:C-terminal processing protease CtpA/Prc
LTIDEGEDFKGWQVEFFLPDKSTHNAFVPKIKGFPAPKKERIKTVEAKDRCTCIELTDEVAYIRIRGMGEISVWAIIFPSIQEKDGKIIKTFLDNANGKYRKLIIDVRNNMGGIPFYAYENLIRPFLDESVTYDEVGGLRRMYRDNLTKSALKTLRKVVSTKKEHVVNTEEIDAPEGFDTRDWVFYRITRRIEPRNRYNFDGSVHVLIDRPTFSGADKYVNTVKRIGFAKLVGRNTGGGCAAYIAPPVIRLPASGMIFRAETELFINPDGSFNALFGTPPDIELPDTDPPKSITKEDLLDDEWIKKVINDL